MNQCYRCGVSGDKVKLYDAISDKGIVKICGNCASLESLPIIKKPTDDQIIDSKRQKSVRDMLTGMNRGKLLAGKEMSLRELVDRNLKSKQVQPHPDLVENFHWTIQRIRRSRKISREEFAKGIGESEATVRMVEQGFLPENNYKVINKIEGYLGISLRKQASVKSPDTTPQFSEQPRGFRLDDSILTKEEKEKKLSFDSSATKHVKIADLRDMRKKYGDEDKKPVDSWEDEVSQDDEKFLDEKEEFPEEEDF